MNFLSYIALVVTGVCLLRFVLARRRRRSVKDKVFIVTGASAGIGAAICHHLAQRGATVVLAARRLEQLQQVAAKLPCDKTLCVRCDILSEDDRKTLISTTVAKFGRLDGIVLNAARGAYTPFDSSDETMAIMRDTMEINLFANVHLTQLALSHIEKCKGVICGISSLAGVLRTPFRSAYSAAKHAVMGFFGALRLEMKSKGVAVVVVCPGYVASDFHENVRTRGGERLPERDLKAYMTPEQCGKQVVDAMEYEIEEVVMTTSGKIAYMLRPWFPEFIDKLVAAKSNASSK